MKSPRANNQKTVTVPDLTRAEALEWAHTTLITGGYVRPEEISFRGLRAADPISAIRNDRLIPVARIMKPSEKYQTTTPDGRTVTRSRRGKTDYYRITADELTLYRAARPQQIARMTEQRANRRRRDLAARVIAELSRTGEAANIPPVFREWAALAVPAPGVGTSAPSIEISIQEKPVCKQQ
ncbi:hypothetical protein OGY37_12205 [Citrobacter sp. Cpo030]|uniref:hypothetical protein n=1 Tax=Citrobacter sp. Cpo030 TaxID=2985122 RepID=UPI002578D6F5|nr:MULTISPECIES: hypothetical protein [Citrobacter]MDM2896795.1 hypothetical protein [Citrobacter sp. Cpo030]MDN4404989.1 hypothetical protein [Citrobacter portucalensis]